MEQLDGEHPIYKKADEELIVGGVEVESIVYFFMEDQFNMAQVVFNSEENFKKLIKVLESRYCKGVKTNNPGGDKFYENNVGRKPPERNRYWWVLEGQNLSLYIEYFEKDKKKGRSCIFTNYLNISMSWIVSGINWGGGNHEW